MLTEREAELLRHYEKRKWNSMTIEQKRNKALKSAISMNPQMATCMDCYYAETSGIPSCAYILMEGHKRPCPPGEGCEVKRVRSAQHDKGETDEAHN